MFADERNRAPENITLITININVTNKTELNALKYDLDMESEKPVYNAAGIVIFINVNTETMLLINYNSQTASYGKLGQINANAEQLETQTERLCSNCEAEPIDRANLCVLCYEDANGGAKKCWGE